MTESPDIRLNLIANYGGQAWRALMAFAFVPFYLRILGVEAYGLIGLFASLQVALALLDGGLRPALAREMARFSGGAMSASEVRTVLRSVEWALLLIALAIAGGMALAAPILARNWVQPVALEAGVVTAAFRAMGFVAALQFVKAAYDSALAGLQRQVLQNAILILDATLRGFGALVVLWNWPSLGAFFLWQALVAVLSLALLAIAVYRSLPTTSAPARFSWPAMRGLGAYAGGLFAISAIALLMTQIDKLLLARLLPLDDLGRYTLATTLAGALGLVAAPIGSTYFPRLTQLLQSGNASAAIAAFRRATVLVVVLVGGATAVQMLFAQQIVMLWLGDARLADAIAPIAALVGLGALLNALTAMPYQLQLAHGVTSIALRINLVLLVIYLPALWLLTARYDGLGAAACWAGLNLLGLFANAAQTLPRFAPGNARNWWLRDVAQPLIAVFLAAALCRWIYPDGAVPLVEAGALALVGVFVLGCGAVVSADLRGAIHAQIVDRRSRG